MFKFGKNSEKKLEKVHFLLQKVLKRAIISTRVDFSIVSGYRDKEMQDSLFRSGHSKLRWPNSKHNSDPSLAVDIAVYRNGKLDWQDLNSYYYLAGLIQAIADSMNITLRFGLDWDRDGDFNDQTFLDAGHIELVNEDTE